MNTLICIDTILCVTLPLYLGIHITSYGNIEEEVRQQVARANKVAGCLNDVIWRNKHLRQDTKVRIYRTTVRPIMTYTSETRRQRQSSSSRPQR